MAKHTQIIEFFGLPACGKSTLCDTLLSEQIVDEMIFCRMKEISTEYRKISIFCKLRIFPYRASFLLFLLILKTGDKRKNLRIYKNFFKIIIIYAFCKYNPSDQYMLIDHGVMQSIVSMFYWTKPGRLESSKWIVNCLVGSIGIDYLIFCDVSVAESISRIRKRNRTESGRLDVINDEDELERTLILQSTQYLKLCEQNTKYIIDMEGTLNELCKNVYSIIREN